MEETHRDAYLSDLVPGADIDHRGTPFTPDLGEQLLDALTDGTTGHARLGKAIFNGAVFTGDARFDDAVFTGNASFDEAVFTGDARFGEAVFTRDADFVGAVFTRNADFNETTFTGSSRFNGATFARNADFEGATFTDHARFRGATFAGAARFGTASFTTYADFEGAIFDSRAEFMRAAFSGYAGFEGVTFALSAGFDEATFHSNTNFKKAAFTGHAIFYKTAFDFDAVFDEAVFAKEALFTGAVFHSDASFTEGVFYSIARFDMVTVSGDAKFLKARFVEASRLGPLVSGGTVLLYGAVFGAPVTLEIAARKVNLRRVRWASTATLKLRYAEVDLDDTVLEYPATVTAHPKPFQGLHGPVPEEPLTGQDAGVRLTSVSGVDTALLALYNIDLSGCRFAGAVHLDQLRIDGWCTFATTPPGWGLRFPWRWSRRRTLAEEYDWRARSARRSHGWTASPQDAPELRPTALAALYRQLRKSLEDGKNEPGAADFYYGESEMRRHDKDSTFRAERILLTAYWALSGYGLRAGRALAWLGTTMTITVMALMLWGLPADDPKPRTTGRQAEAGQELSLTTDTPDPRNPTGRLTERVTSERFEKSLRVVINSVVFRSSGQHLTTAGTYTEMASRVTEPVLLGLAVLAIRNRVKR
ncbi:pentapeptide repeat-containing protein [Streptomyces sp. NPDC058653]|uniref:pentapeptide repeat-containing protein n=1 Tax=Streptomyces sp. NPDC058653 TaxID=3346576 RepID=UPI00365C1A39